MTPPPWHDDLWQTLMSRRQRDALAHALLLAGPAGLGKRAFSERFAHTLLCRQPRADGPCGDCRSCRLLAAGTHPDLVQVHLETRDDGKLRSEILVRQIRELSERLSKSSQFGGWQVVLIDPADAMNVAASNALLKTLEEPSTDSMLLLVADMPWRLSATIRSRCQRMDFRLPQRDQALAWLRTHECDAPENALDAAGGNPGLAAQWAEQGVLPQRDEVRTDLRALAQGRAEPLAVVGRWMEDVPQQRLWFAAQAAADETRARALKQAPPLQSAMDTDQLQQWFHQACSARESLRGPLRKDLIILELLAAWR